jgi:hypothetical protein
MKPLTMAAGMDAFDDKYLLQIIVQAHQEKDADKLDKALITGITIKCFSEDFSQVLCRILQFDEADDFSEGLAKVEINGKSGFIDRSGKIVIKADFKGDAGFNAAGSFYEGLAPVSINGKYGFIDKAGNLKIKPQFDIAMGFNRGLAGVGIILGCGGGL